MPNKPVYSSQILFAQDSVYSHSGHKFTHPPGRRPVYPGLGFIPLTVGDDGPTPEF